MIFARDNTVTNVRSFQVYDRWGEKMWEDQNFQPNDEAHSWDGVFKGEKTQPQVFIYYAEVELIDGNVLLLEGDVTLMN